MAKSVRLAGFHSILARVRMAPDTVQTVYVDQDRRDPRMRHFLEVLEKAKVHVVAVGRERLEGLSNGNVAQGAVALCEERELGLSFEDVLDTVNSDMLLLILDGVTDARNLGACLRVADAAGVTAVIIPRNRSATLGTEGARASAGASESVPLIEVTNLSRAMTQLSEAGVTLIGTDGEAEHSLFDLPFAGAVAWVMGAEGDGMRRLTRENCDLLAKIPLLGQVESLNVSVATGICLYESVRRRLSVDA